MKSPNFICVENTGYGADEFTIGSGGKFVSSWEEMHSNTTFDMCWAGFFRPQWLEICQRHNLKYYNLDGAYFGNGKSKIFVRLTANGFQNTEKIIERPPDRWKILDIKLENFSQGDELVIVPPDRKICQILQLGTIDEWCNNLIVEIRRYTDRPLKIRTRPNPRSERTTTNTFKEFIRNNTYCVIGYSSNALVEAAMFGIPVISLGHSATQSLYEYGIDKMDSIKPADIDKKMSWLYHLSYCQFNRQELLSGFAWKIINN